MKKRPNVLWLMSDQHNANCSGYAGNPDVKTPNLDRIAGSGVNFTNGFANNPICSPSRICFMTGQYMRNHQLFGNDHAEYPHQNPDTLACKFRRYGYQTGLFGKSHMIRCWDEDGFEKIRYTDLCDARHDDPNSTHYFKYLDDLGLADHYEEGNAKPGQEYMNNGSGYSTLPYEHSVEHYTGNETLEFLEERDESRPFFIHMSFQRPHAPIAPSKEFFEMYDPDKISLPESKDDWLEDKFATKPQHLQDQLNAGCTYPLATNESELRRCIASYYGLISAIDMEIGRVLDRLEEMGELENTIIFYTADHGDFAGEHGLFHKNFGLYESIQRVPFLFRWPGSPQGIVSENLVESIDLYPTLCELCNIPLPENIDGTSLVNYATTDGKDAVFCEWESFEGNLRLSAIRTKRFRLVFYGTIIDGELYDRSTDSGEVNNLWNNPKYADIKMELMMQLMDFTLKYNRKTDITTDRKLSISEHDSPTKLLHKNGIYWSDLQAAYNTKKSWPPID